MGTGKIVLLIFGIILIVVSIPLLLTGVSFTLLSTSATDSEGFMEGDTIHIERGSYAIVSNVEIEEEAPDTLEWLGMDTFKIEASSNDESKQIFIGIAEQSDVEAYLQDVEYDESELFTDYTSNEDVEYTNHPGDSEPEVPTDQDFWTQEVHGDGTQVIKWEVEAGNYSIVLMNSDSSADIDFDVVPKVKMPRFVTAIGVVILIGGIVALVGGIVMLYFALRKRKSSEEPLPEIPA